MIVLSTPELVVADNRRDSKMNTHTNTESNLTEWQFQGSLNW